MVAVLDFGNSKVKLAVYKHDKAIEITTISLENFIEESNLLFKKYNDITHIVVASVNHLSENLIQHISKDKEICIISQNSKLPYNNHYKTPHTLGIDRIVLSAGAVFSYPNQNRLVIDAGTCITYDFVTKENNYLGGAISPGIAMRYKALHHFTSKLPLLNFNESKNYIGNSTQDAIHGGVIQGVIYEIEGFIAQYKKDYDNFIIILTGGDAVFLAKNIKNSIFAQPNFLLESLYQLFLYQTKNE